MRQVRKNQTLNISMLESVSMTRFIGSGKADQNRSTVA